MFKYFSRKYLRAKYLEIQTQTQLFARSCVCGISLIRAVRIELIKHNTKNTTPQKLKRVVFFVLCLINSIRARPIRKHNWVRVFRELCFFVLCLIN